LSIERWWEAATTGVDGLSKAHENMATFAARQFLDTVAPSNFIWTNPQVLERTQAQWGANLLRGLSNWTEDVTRLLTWSPPLEFEVARASPWRWRA